MKKTLISLASMLLVAGSIGVASATLVGFDVAGNPVSSVKAIAANGFFSGNTNISATLASTLDGEVFQLADGQTKMIDFFTLSVEGIGFDSYTVGAILGFDSPDMGKTIGSGAGYFATLGGILSGGTLNWTTAPGSFMDINGNNISVDFESGVAFGLGNTAMVHASITNNGGGTAPVPEPSTMILVGLGLAGLIGYNRKHFGKRL